MDQQDPCPPYFSSPESVQRLVCLFQYKGPDLRSDRHPWRQRQKLHSVLPGEVSHGAEHPFAPEEIVGERGDITHMDASANDGSASSYGPERRWDQFPGRGKDDGRMKFRRRKFVGIARPDRPHLSGELLSLTIACFREGIDFSPLPPRHLGHDVGRRAEAVDSEPLPLTRHDQRTVADESGAEQRRRLKVGVPLRKGKTETMVGHGVLGEAAIYLITGKPGCIAEVFLVAAAVSAVAAGPAEPRDTDPVSLLKPLHSFTDPGNPADHLMSGHQRQLRLVQFAVNDMEVGAADAAGMDPDEELTGFRFRNRQLFQHKGFPDPFEHHGAHQRFSFQHKGFPQTFLRVLVRAFGFRLVRFELTAGYHNACCKPNLHKHPAPVFPVHSSPCSCYHPLMTTAPLLLFAYLLVFSFGLLLRFLNRCHLKRYGGIVPGGFEGSVDQETLSRTSAYTLEQSRVGLVESILDTALLLVFLFGGILPRYDQWIASLSDSFILQGLLFFLVLYGVQVLVGIPFGLYSTFRLEARYGFNTTTPGIWLTDLFKSTGISLALMGLLLSGALALVQTSPHWWWFWVWLLFAAVSLFLMYLSPYVIEPLFNKFEPVTEEGLEGEITALMGKAGLTVSKVQQVDASKRSRHSNAYFTGIGRVKRIVLYDTLIALMTHQEILAVLAHEVGHWKLGHIRRRLVLTEVSALAITFLSWWLITSGVLPHLLELPPAPETSFMAQMVILSFLGTLAGFPLTPLSSWLSRRHEWQADKFAVELSGLPGALATALVKLSTENLSNFHPHPLYATWYYSHPPVVQRVARLTEAR